MLAIMELFLDALSIGQDIRRDREEDRRRRGRGGMRLTYGLMFAVILIVLAVFKLF
jgi:hypothetical protein